jgi:hypothetical protein
MRTRLAASALSGSLIILALTGCGDDADTAAEEASPSASSSSPSDSPSTPPSSATSTESGGDEAESAAFLERLKAGMGEEGSVHVDMEMTGPFQAKAQGDTAYGPDGSEMQLTMEMSNLPGGALEMVLVDGKAYMSMPGVTEPGTFFEVDQSNPAFGSLDDGLSPADSFKAFDAGLEKVEEVGTEEVGGVETTHYRLSVDARSALEATGQGNVPGLPKTLDYDVWLDSDDRMRRLVYELAGTKLTMDMTDWGKEVSVEAPSPDDIVEAPPMMGG